MANILIVDDDDVIRETLYELLSVDYTCDRAITATEALSKLDVQSFDVLLTDISMPGLSGFELLRKVVEQFPSTAVIIISGISDEEQAQELISLGAFDYLVKPFRLEYVEASVRLAVQSAQQKRKAADTG
jgi:DNA-binding NtrC family response regulator